MLIAHQVTGLKDIIGFKSAETVRCRFQLVSTGGQVQASGYQNYVFEPDGSLSSYGSNVEYNTTASINFILEAAQTTNAQASPTACTNYAVSGNQTLISTFESIENENTGVYEYTDIMLAVAGVALLVAIIGRGIIVAKRAGRAFVEDTNADDALEWYEGENGKEYFRIKSNRYRG